ncbi:transcription factor Adf-1-like isoform X1 [Leptinotarsa decemlineata]|uniref:transcription factor Adf-1-like isoform X1 n=1 Tax=Leptinotarsa decemlineata TaxID=7539 RepID=UPI003D305C48
MAQSDSDYLVEESEVELEATHPLVQSEITDQEHEGTTFDPGLLIEAIQQFEFLYDLSNKSYKNTNKKHQAWQHISTIPNSSVEECMKLWKHLRDRFVKEKNKFPSGAGAPISNWPHFEAMLFYNKFTKKRKTYTA